MDVHHDPSERPRTLRLPLGGTSAPFAWDWAVRQCPILSDNGVPVNSDLIVGMRFVQVAFRQHDEIDSRFLGQLAQLIKALPILR